MFILTSLPRPDRATLRLIFVRFSGPGTGWPTSKNRRPALSAARPKKNKNAPSFLAQHWFLLALAILLPSGVLGAKTLAGLNTFVWPRTVIVCLVMGLMALPIPLELIRKSLARPWPSLLASVINMGVIPLLAWLAALTLPAYLGGGLIVAATIPCTLASAAVWTRRAGGDDTVAILVTLATNLTCVVVTPLWLVMLLGRSVDLQMGPLIRELVLVVLLPIAVAQALRVNRTIALWAERHKLALALTCQVGILTMVFLGAIQMGQHLQGSAQASVLEVVWTALLAAAIHLGAMAMGWQAAARTGVARPQQIGVAIAGSQKTLMIGLKLAMDCGVSILPMVAFHVGQLLLDTFIADRWRGITARQDAARTAAAADVGAGGILSHAPPSPNHGETDHSTSQSESL